MLRIIREYVEYNDGSHKEYTIHSNTINSAYNRLCENLERNVNVRYYEIYLIQLCDGSSNKVLRFQSNRK